MVCGLPRRPTTSISARVPAALAFIARRPDAAWMLEVYAGFEAAATQAKHFALLASAGGRTLEPDRIESLLADHARGIAISEVLLSDTARALLPRLRRQGVPLVFSGAYDPAVDCDWVVADNVAAGRLAVEHLVRLGHRHIAFFALSEEMMEAKTSLQHRQAGYHQAMRDAYAGGRGSAGFPEHAGAVLVDTLPTDLDDAERAERLRAFLTRSRATAAVAANDTLALLAMRHLRAAGLTVPDDLALVGISDERVAALADVPLTTVRIDAAVLGAETAQLLLRRLAGDQSPPQHKVLPVHLIVRASCGARTHRGTVEPYEPVHAARDAAAALGATLGF